MFHFMHCRSMEIVAFRLDHISQHVGFVVDTLTVGRDCPCQFLFLQLLHHTKIVILLSTLYFHDIVSVSNQQHTRKIN
jgi:hypothetical protein